MKNVLKGFDLTLFLLIIYFLIAGMVIEYIFHQYFEIQPFFPDLLYIPLFLAVALIIGVISGRRNEAEKELMESEGRLKSFMDSATDGFILLDTELDIIDINRVAIEKICKENIMGKKKTSIFDLIPDINKNDRQKKYLEVIRTGKPYFEEDVLHHPKFGELYFSMQSFKVGSGIGIIYTDITERKKNEEHLRNAERLKLENVALDEANKLKSEFMANMSHDLRTPLNSIIGYSELLQDQTFGGLNEKQHHYLDVILSNGTSLLDLINDILDVSSIEAGKLEFNFEQLRMDKIVKDIQTANMPMVKDKHHRLDVEVEPGLTVWADELRVRQCLNNLLSNAIKFTPDGGHIWIKGYKKDKLVEVSVEDTGRGIPSGKLGSIFQPFYRVNDEQGDITDGTGLGLPITRRVIDLMGGELWVESEVGKSSTFYFTLPAHPPSKKNDKSASP